ncbi:MAG: hypothetical protein AB7F86_13715 [Bdellovibrionales bacterium]
MTADKLDFLFPFFVFFYGITITLVLSSPLFMRLAETRMPPAITQQLKGHRVLGLICLFLGGFWSLQNLWL